MPNLSNGTVSGYLKGDFRLCTIKYSSTLFNNI